MSLKPYLLAGRQAINTLLGKPFLTGYIAQQPGLRADLANGLWLGWQNQPDILNDLVQETALLAQQQIGVDELVAEPCLAARRIKAIARKVISDRLYREVSEGDNRAVAELRNWLFNRLLSTDYARNIQPERLEEVLQDNLIDFIEKIKNRKIENPEQTLNLINNLLKWRLSDNAKKTVNKHEILESTITKTTNDSDAPALEQQLAPSSNDPVYCVEDSDGQAILLAGLLRMLTDGHLRPLELVLLLLLAYNPTPSTIACATGNYSERLEIALWLESWRTNPQQLKGWLSDIPGLTPGTIYKLDGLLSAGWHDLSQRKAVDSAWIGNLVYQARQKIQRRREKYFAALI